MEDDREVMDRSRDLECVGILEVQKHKQVGFICGSLPVPTYDISNPGVFGFLTSQDLIPSHAQRVRAPRYRMLPTETDLNTLPSVGILPEQVISVTTPHKTGDLECATVKKWSCLLKASRREEVVKSHLERVQ